MTNEQIINEFIRDLQWDLRASYNSSSCLNSKQQDFLKDRLGDLLEELQPDPTWTPSKNLK